MTREDSIRTSMWVTNDGRYLHVSEITDSHLSSIRGMLCADMTPGYNQSTGRETARDYVSRHESLLDYTIDGTWVELDRDAYAAAWLQIIDAEFVKRQVCL